MSDEQLGDGDGPRITPSSSSQATVEQEASRSQIVGQVRKSIDESDDPSEYDLHFVMPTGESEHLRFYLVCWTIPHPSVDDAALHKLRYFQSPKSTAPAALHPKFKTNGMAMRGPSDGLMLYALLEGFAAARSEDTPAWVDHLVSDEHE